MGRWTLAAVAVLMVVGCSASEAGRARTRHAAATPGADEASPESWGARLAKAQASAAAGAAAAPGTAEAVDGVLSPMVEVPPENTPAEGGPITTSGTQLPRGEKKLIANHDGPLEVPTGRSIILELNADAERVAIADPEIAEVVLITPREVLINGKGKKVTQTSTDHIAGTSLEQTSVNEGQTSITVWDRQGHHDMRTLYVNRARTEQILLQVTIADLNRSKLEQRGFDFQFLQGGVFVTQTQGKLFNFSEYNDTFGGAVSGFNEALSLQDERISYVVRDLNDDFLAFIELLQRENLAKILAKPTVLARSGEEAHFRVGGEVPVVYATQNVATVNFKEFGVILTVTPSLTDDGQVDMRVATEVSEPTDAFRATTLEGFSIPAFISRKAETRVRLPEGETLLIAGLFRENETEIEDKTPYLGDVPYLGALFRRTRFDYSRNELLIMVSPRVVGRAKDTIPAMLPTDRGPLTRDEVRTGPNPNEVTRPRFPVPHKRGAGSERERLGGDERWPADPPTDAPWPDEAPADPVAPVGPGARGTPEPL